MTPTDFECAILALYCWRKSKQYGLDTMIASAHLVKNRSVRDNLSTADAIKQHYTSNFEDQPDEDSYPDSRDPQFVKLLRAIDDVYYNRADDITNGAMYCADLSAPIYPDFKIAILDKPDEHPMCAIIGRFHYWK